MQKAWGASETDKMLVWKPFTDELFIFPPKYFYSQPKQKRNENMQRFLSSPGEINILKWNTNMKTETQQTNQQIGKLYKQKAEHQKCLA